jgi:transposase
MPRKKYHVALSAEERMTLEQLLRHGQAGTRKLTRARILLKADAGLSDEEIAAALAVGPATVRRMRQRFVKESLRALDEHVRPGAQRKLTANQEARVIAVAYTPAPKGHTRWTLRLLADKVVEMGVVDSISHETVRRVLKKNERKPWQQRCLPAVNAEFGTAMEDMLDLYAEPCDPNRAKVNLAETASN